MSTENESAVRTKLEFLIDVNEQEQVDRLRKALAARPELQNIDIDLPSRRLVLDTTIHSSKVQQLVEESLETNAVLLGTGKQLGAAVSALYSNINRASERRAHGLVRFIQTDDERCVIEGSVDGLRPNASVQINIHEYGDLSDGCDSCGDYYKSSSSTTANPIGVLGEVKTDDQGSTDFRLVNRQIRIPDLIGRSFVVQTSDAQRVACGIIARSAGLFENTKRLCSCSGATVWQERREAKERLPFASST